jgi:hypothetical protein
MAERRASGQRLIRIVVLGVALTGTLGAALLIGTPRRETRALRSANPLSATFEASDAQIRACLTNGTLDIEAGGGTRVHFMRFTAAEGHPSAVFGDPANARDVFLESIDPNPLSDVYFAGEKPLPYTVSLHVHIVPVSERETSVELRAKDYKVITGEKLDIPVHAWRKNVYEAVPPTTIDEYRILKVIASCLGKDTLPPTITP